MGAQPPGAHVNDGWRNETSQDDGAPFSLTSFADLSTVFSTETKAHLQSVLRNRLWGRATCPDVQAFDDGLLGIGLGSNA